MGSDDRANDAVDGARRRPGVNATIETLADSPGHIVTTALLEVLRLRADERTPADVMQQYGRDRFVAPSTADAVALTRAKLSALELVSAEFEPIELAPVAPLGTHSTVAGVHQHRIVSTVRMTEVLADPTNSLALECARRRRGLLAINPRTAERVALATTARVLRAQRFDGPMSFAHFELLALVVAGRDEGDRRFEREAGSRVISSLAEVAAAVSGLPVQVALTDFAGTQADVLDAIAADLSSHEVSVDVDRQQGHGYYPSVCFKISVGSVHERIEVGDGGIVDWTQGLVASKKERCMIGAVSLERLLLANPTTG